MSRSYQVSVHKYEAVSGTSHEVINIGNFLPVFLREIPIDRRRYNDMFTSRPRLQQPHVCLSLKDTDRHCKNTPRKKLLAEKGQNIVD